MRTQFFDVLDLPFSGIACSIISCLVVGIFMPKNSIATKFCRLALGGTGTVIMPHRVYLPCSKNNILFIFAITLSLVNRIS